MRQKLYSGIVKKLASGIAMFGIAASGNVFSYQAIDHQKGMISKEKVVAEREKIKFGNWARGGF